MSTTEHIFWCFICDAYRTFCRMGIEITWYCATCGFGKGTKRCSDGDKLKDEKLKNK